MTTGLVLSLNQILDLYRNKVKTIRKQNCGHCWTTLAIQATDTIERGSVGDFYIVTGGLVVKGEFEPYYARSDRWFGNMITCPKCRHQIKLPGDKPLNWEQMQKEREVGNV